MDPAKWENPEEFNPNRFLTDDGKYKMLSNFIPFQTGKRICPGEELAKMILYSFSAYILKKYTISLPISKDNISFDGICGITLTPQNFCLVFDENK